MQHVIGGFKTGWSSSMNHRRHRISRICGWELSPYHCAGSLHYIYTHTHVYIRIIEYYSMMWSNLMSWYVLECYKMLSYLRIFTYSYTYEGTCSNSDFPLKPPLLICDAQMAGRFSRLGAQGSYTSSAATSAGAGWSKGSAGSLLRDENLSENDALKGYLKPYPKKRFVPWFLSKETLNVPKMKIRQQSGRGRKKSSKTGHVL